MVIYSIRSHSESMGFRLQALDSGDLYVRARQQANVDYVSALFPDSDAEMG